MHATVVGARASASQGAAGVRRADTYTPPFKFAGGARAPPQQLAAGARGALGVARKARVRIQGGGCSHVVVAMATDRRAGKTAAAAATEVAVTAQETGDEPVPVSPDDLQLPPGELTQVMRPPNGLAEDGSKVTVTEYLKKVLTSKVYDAAVVTPLEEASRLSERVENTILLKREDQQPVFSFKLRGAYNCMAQLSKEQLAAGVITASAGNHAQGVAMSAAKLGCSAIVAMPTATPAIKVNNVRRLGAHVELVGKNFDQTQAWARAKAVEENRTFIPPFDHPDTIAGQGTIGMEIFNQTDVSNLHAIFVPIGGGGLIAGIAAYVKALKPEIKIIGVEPAGANAMAFGLQLGKRVELSKVDAFADGVAVRQVGIECYRLCQELVDGVVLVDTDMICGAIKDVFEDTRSILEPAGALGVAGAKAYLQHYNLKGLTCVAITSGANMNFDTLRTVSELADLGTRTEALLASFIPEETGSFKTFYNTIGKDVNITEFKYRYQGASEVAQILYSVSVRNQSEVADLQARLNANNMQTLDMSSDSIVKDHLRHLVGGSSCVRNEKLYQFIFPERPGSLSVFLEALGTDYNITLFHYRFTGGNVGKVLVGIVLEDERVDNFHAMADALKPEGFEYNQQATSPAHQFCAVGSADML